MFERVDYRVERIDGDYAYLKRVDVPDGDEIRFCDMPKRHRRYE